MSLILSIDTSLEFAQIGLGKNGELIAHSNNSKQSEHAAWIHTAIKNLLHENLLTLRDLSAVAVTIGPGSYTGLRVGLSAAKGLCYALGIPLITIGTLEFIARSYRQREASFFCPMIDARRMEVFTAVYNQDMHLVKEPTALVLEANSFDEFLAAGTVIFCGNGCSKYEGLVENSNAVLISGFGDIIVLNKMATEALDTKRYADLAYSEPLYLKEFHDTSRK